ncbi:MAG: DUF2752 domain-containing protein [Candidatus Nanopelagicales bacterium]|nr:DUF2752 domain-containing protein [Candidatus Nanopelagicales bacterium]MDZ4249336.1 DUF2752 domain-containing protein [Candidatus Nanopelagicales bacterium]
MTVPSDTRTRRVWLSLEDHDAWTGFTWFALGGLLLAVAMAIFGLPPLDMHGPLHAAGYMDPLCGGTRAVRLAAMGDFAESWRYNPIGIPVVLTGAVLVVRGAFGLISGRWPSMHIRWTRRGKWIAVAVVIALIVALEVNQQSHAELLM